MVGVAVSWPNPSDVVSKRKRWGNHLIQGTNPPTTKKPLRRPKEGEEGKPASRTIASLSPSVILRGSTHLNIPPHVFRNINLRKEKWYSINEDEKRIDANGERKILLKYIKDRSKENRIVKMDPSGIDMFAKMFWEMQRMMTCNRQGKSSSVVGGGHVSSMGVGGENASAGVWWWW
jgi:hypothetical protein